LFTDLPWDEEKGDDKQKKSSITLLDDVLRKTKKISESDLAFDEFDPSIEEPTEQMAVLDSENFAVYSNVEFLYLIGKYAAQSKSNHAEGLQALNDYLLIMDRNRNNFKLRDFYRQRALAVYEIG
jgi:hypothetical protein